jgi:hypothetical protein
MPGAPLLYRLPMLLVAGFLAAVMVLTLLLAHAHGRRALTRGKTSGDLGALEAMASGLLGLLLAFNFSFAQSRFDSRQALIVRETNAIGTAYLRCSVLDTEDRAFCRDRLRRYVVLRIQAYKALGNTEGLPIVFARLQEGGRVQNELWALGARVTRDHPTPPNALLLAGLNDVIDLDAERRASLRILVPEPVTIAIMLACLGWAALLGYGSGARGQTFPRTSWLVIALLISLVFGIALDLDQPRHGFVTTVAAERSMEELRQAVEAPDVD